MNFRKGKLPPFKFLHLADISTKMFPFQQKKKSEVIIFE